MFNEGDPSGEKSPRDIFLEAVKENLLKLKEQGRIDDDRIADKLRAAEMIEEGFNNPKEDAQNFTLAGIAGESELTHEFKKSDREQGSAKDVFFDKLKDELAEMLRQGIIDKKNMDEKLESGALIETGFSNDPEQDAKDFAKAGLN